MAIPTADYPGYRDDPLGFITDILRMKLSPDQQRTVMELVRTRRVLASSGHSVGKTILGAALILWFHYTHFPSVCLTTAPTERQVKDQLWKEVRGLAEEAGLSDHWAGDKSPRLETTANHFAHGFTARDATRFQGQHSRGGLMIVFDEAEGIDIAFWRALRSMLDDNSYFIAFYNPTGQNTATHQREQEASERQSFSHVRLSCVDHPNIQAGLSNLTVPFPGAITLNQLREMLLEDSMVLAPNEAREPGDVVLGTERYRPGPIATARCLGRRPSTSSTGLWSEELWARVLSTKHEIKPEWPVAIGCDVGRYGDDKSVIMVRKGYCLIHAETHCKLGTDVLAQKVREAAYRFQDGHNPAKRIPCLVDEGGIGGGVIDQADGYHFIPVNASCRPREPHRYPKVRDELWFNARQAAHKGLMDLSRVNSVYLNRLKAELFSAEYRVVDGTDMMKVSSKDEMKLVLGRSPDLADAFNLTYY